MKSARRGGAWQFVWLLAIVLGVIVLTQGNGLQKQSGLLIELDQATYKPEMEVNIRVELPAVLSPAAPGQVVLQITHLTDVVETQRRDLTTVDGAIVNFTWLPPATPRGYGITVHLEQDGQ